LTVCGTAIAGESVRVVTGLTLIGVDIAVATASDTGLRDTSGIAAGGLLGTGPRAPRAVTVEKTVQRFPEVTAFTIFDFFIAAIGRNASARRTRTRVARFSETGRRATVIALLVAIVAVFDVRNDDAIATDRGAGLSGSTTPPCLDRLTICGTTVTVLRVAVIAGFRGR
jgi:hypothetical protein